jgi:hypothetical protein
MSAFYKGTNKIHSSYAVDIELVAEALDLVLEVC